jgi:hypothetical protein
MGSSGIIDMKSIQGPNRWLMVTQAHTLHVSQFGGLDEAGQLMLLKIPRN